MFEFSIKSSKNIKELNIVFEEHEGSLVSENVSLDSKPSWDSKDSISSKPKEIKETPKRTQEKQETNTGFLSFDDIQYNEIQNVIIQKPEIPSVNEINVADELHNLDF